MASIELAIETAKRIAGKLGFPVWNFEGICFVHDYCEPGYDLEEKNGIFLGNWNRVSGYGESNMGDRDPMVRLSNILEKQYQLEWSDEWSICDDCGKAVRTIENSYYWRPYYSWVSDCGIVCHDCLSETERIELVVNKPSKCLTSDIDLIAHGFEKHNGKFETGLHTGMNDDPKQVYKKLRAEFPKAEIVFSLDENSQFYSTWSAWYRLPETEEMEETESWD